VTYDLDRFVAAQDSGGTYHQALGRAARRLQDQPLDVVRVPADRRSGPQRNAAGQGSADAGQTVFGRCSISSSTARTIRPRWN
jgi:hypothetical protein